RFPPPPPPPGRRRRGGAPTPEKAQRAHPWQPPASARAGARWLPRCGRDFGLTAPGHRPGGDHPGEVGVCPRAVRRAAMAGARRSVGGSRARQRVDDRDRHPEGDDRQHGQLAEGPGVVAATLLLEIQLLHGASCGRFRMRISFRQPHRPPFFSTVNFGRLPAMSKDSKPERESHVAAGEAAGASADPWGYVWDPRGYYWHPLARHWYEPYSQVYYSEDGQVLPPEVAQAQLARAMGWE